MSGRRVENRRRSSKRSLSTVVATGGRRLRGPAFSLTAADEHASERLPELEVRESFLLVAEAEVDPRHERFRQRDADAAAVAVAERARDAADDRVVQPEFV